MTRNGPLLAIIFVFGIGAALAVALALGWIG